MVATANAHEVDSLEKAEKQTVLDPVPAVEELDIEHAFVKDDPRKWSRQRKV
jgi:hypothetical protein